MKTELEKFIDRIMYPKDKEVKNDKDKQKSNT